MGKPTLRQTISRVLLPNLSKGQPVIYLRRRSPIASIYLPPGSISDGQPYAGIRDISTCGACATYVTADRRELLPHVLTLTRHRRAVILFHADRTFQPPSR